MREQHVLFALYNRGMQGWMLKIIAACEPAAQKINNLCEPCNVFLLLSILSDPQALSRLFCRARTNH